jgi:hypothetical protein
MKLRVLHHDHCFDGLASAAVFSRFFSSRINSSAEIDYTGLAHKPNQKVIEEELFDGDQNAIVDFKYSPSSKLTWWFDHHQSAFLSADDERHFLADKSPTKFYDPAYKSCTKFIADVAATRYGFELGDLEGLVHWADVIDGAFYRDAREAVEMEAPAMRLTLVIEATRDASLMRKIIADMQAKPLDQIMREPAIDREFQPLYSRHLGSIDLIRNAARFERGVVYFDLSGHDVEGYSKFIPYYLFPDSVYSVGVSRSATRSKVSVGFNPWSPQPRRHNLASICERYNGGGHAVVGAISLAPDQIELARETARSIAAELRS